MTVKVIEQTSALAGLELLATAVILLDRARRVTYANPAAENLFELSRRQLVGHAIEEIFTDAANLTAAIGKSTETGASYTEQELELTPSRQAEAPPHLHRVPVEADGGRAAAGMPSHRSAAQDRA